VISRKVLASIILGVAGVLIMTWRIARIPAHVVIINQSGKTLQHVAIDTGVTRFELGTLNNAETRRFSVDATNSLRLVFRGKSDHVWNDPEPLTAGQSLVLYVTPDERVEPRTRIGTLVR
jgi:hypothetical protein